MKDPRCFPATLTRLAGAALIFGLAGCASVDQLQALIDKTVKQNIAEYKQATAAVEEAIKSLKETQRDIAKVAKVIEKVALVVSALAKLASAV